MASPMGNSESLNPAKDAETLWRYQPTSMDLLKRARLNVLGRATDLKDGLMLLEMLGLEDLEFRRDDV